MSERTPHLPSERIERIERIECVTCTYETKHTVVAEYGSGDSQEVGEHGSIDWHTTYTLLECRGCGGVTLRQAYRFSENDYNAELTYFPPRVSRRAPPWIDRVDRDTQALMHEVYTALYADSRRLALMGARTAIDLLIVRRVGDTGTFAQKMDALERQGILGARNRAVLEAALEAGNAAIHRGHSPSASDLAAVLDIVEHVLHAELLEVDAEQLRQGTPPRPPRGAPAADA
jgi:hypothetical protein